MLVASDTTQHAEQSSWHHGIVPTIQADCFTITSVSVNAITTATLWDGCIVIRIYSTTVLLVLSYNMASCQRYTEVHVNL